jgi:peptide/nickel transport system substrate-binding protein
MPAYFPLNRRRLFGAVSASAALLLFGGTKSRAAQPGGTLVVSLLGDLPTLNPMVRFTANSWRLVPNFYNGLTYFTPSGQLQPDLALSWEAADEARLWTFKLRPGVRFYNGDRFTAADVVATFNKMQAPETSAPYLGEMGPLVRVEAVDDLTARFRMSSPYADLPRTLATSTAKIISQAGIAAFDDIDRHPRGTGPFLLKEFVPNDHLVMERNPDYFGGPALLDRVVVRLLPDPTAQLAALRNREIDAIGEIEGDTFSRLSHQPGVRLLNVSSGTFDNLILFANKPPFDNPKLRLALKLAMDRQAIAEALTENTGIPGDDHPLAPVYQFADTSVPLRQPDLAQAKQLMREAGHGSGLQHKLVVAANPPSRQKMAILCQAMAAQIGIDLQIELMDNTRFLAQVWNKGQDSYIGNYVTRQSADAILTKIYHSKLGIDEGRWATPETDAILDQARATTDPAVRGRLYAEFQRRSRDTGPFVIPAFFDALAVHNDYVTDFPVSGIGLDMRFDRTSMTAAAPQRQL